VLCPPYEESPYSCFVIHGECNVFQFR
jgi:hypothetical protein